MLVNLYFGDYYDYGHGHYYHTCVEAESTDIISTTKETIEEYHKGKTIAIPYKIGCARGGGDWNIVYKMIEEAFADSDCEVLICESDKG